MNTETGTDRPNRGIRPTPVQVAIGLVAIVEACALSVVVWRLLH